MLDACARGWTMRDKKHRRWITWQGRTSTLTPLGEHGTRTDYEIEAGKVRNLVWTLGINVDCANGLLKIPIRPRP